MQLRDRCWDTSNREMLYKYLKGLVSSVGQRHVLSFGDRQMFQCRVRDYDPLY